MNCICMLSEYCKKDIGLHTQMSIQNGNVATLNLGPSYTLSILTHNVQEKINSFDLQTDEFRGQNGLLI